MAFATPVTATYDLDQNQVGLTGTAGTVTLTQVSSTEVDIAVSLGIVNGNQAVFAMTGGPHTPFAFNLDSSVLGSAVVSILSPVGDFKVLTGSQSATPYGTFTTGITCTVCGNGTSPPNRDAVTVKVTAAGGLGFSDFIKNNSGYYFAADVGVNGKTGSWASDQVTTGGGGGGGGGGPPAVPEPSGLAVLATALLGLFLVRRRSAA